MLFTIDPRPAQAQLRSAEANLLRERSQLRQSEAALAQRRAEAAQARANLARDQAQKENARLQLARADRLVKEEVVTPDEHDRLRTSFLALKATVEADEAAIDTIRATTAAAQALIDSSRAAVIAAEAAVDGARLQLAYTAIRSPIDGRVGQRLVDVGNVVSVGGVGESGVLVVIQRHNPIYVDFTVPENELSAVQRSIAAGTATVEVRLPDEKSRGRTGRLTFLDNAVQEGTGTVKLRATLANADRHFWPGRFVKVRLVLRIHLGAVLVPATAPQRSAKGPFVYVVKADSSAELRPVTLGQRHGDKVAITRGLKAGERVITAGQLAVMPGGKVRAEAARPAGARNAGAPGRKGP